MIHLVATRTMAMPLIKDLESAETRHAPYNYSECSPTPVTDTSIPKKSSNQKSSARPTQLEQRSISGASQKKSTLPRPDKLNLFDSVEDFLFHISNSAETSRPLAPPSTEADINNNYPEPPVARRIPLCRNSLLFQEIERYINESLEQAPYTSTIQEDARMAHAKDVIQSPTATSPQKKRAKQRLFEGETGGLKPVQSTPVKITGIEAIVNPDLLKNYINKKHELLSRNYQNPTQHVKPTTRFLLDDCLADSAGEKLLLHGASEEVVNKIVETGFRPDLGANMGTKDSPRYGALGQGTYFSDMVSKVVTYSMDPELLDYSEDSSHEHVMILAGTLLGRPKLKAGIFSSENLRSEDHQTITPRCDSVYSLGMNVSLNPFISSTRTNEFLLKTPCSMYPAFLVRWRHDKQAATWRDYSRQISGELAATLPWGLQQCIRKIAFDCVLLIIMEAVLPGIPQTAWQNSFLSGLCFSDKSG